MKYIKILFLFLGLLNCFSTYAGNFEVKVAIVDVQAILEQSIAIQGIRKSIDAISQDIQKEMSKKEVELKKIEEDLIKKRGVLNGEAFEKEANSFNKKVSEAQKDMQSKKTRLEQAHAEAIGKIHEATIAIISDLAKKHDFNLVLPSSQVLFATNNLNISSEVIALLNTKIKEIKVNYK